MVKKKKVFKLKDLMPLSYIDELFSIRLDEEIVLIKYLMKCGLDVDEIESAKYYYYQNEGLMNMKKYMDMIRVEE